MKSEKVVSKQNERIGESAKEMPFSSKVTKKATKKQFTYTRTFIITHSECSNRIIFECINGWHFFFILLVNGRKGNKRGGRSIECNRHKHGAGKQSIKKKLSGNSMFTV